MNTNEMQVIESKVDVTDYKQIAVDYLQNMGLRLPQKYATQFIELCSLYGLNPLKREIYAVGYGDNYNIITGYEVYIKRAERLGTLDGWDCVTSGKGDDMIATVTIHRKDWKYPFTHSVIFSECVQTTKEGRPNRTWSKMPSFMLKKVAIAQGFRMCFPDEFGGMPYIADEMPEVEGQEKTENLKSANIDNQSLSPQAEALKKQTVDASLYLENLIEGNKSILDVHNQNGNPYNLAKNAIATKDLDVINGMINRVTTYVKSKGGQVA